jgi:hypothetical protein
MLATGDALLYALEELEGLESPVGRLRRWRGLRFGDVVQCILERGIGGDLVSLVNQLQDRFGG